VGRARRVFIAPLHEMNLPPIKSFIKLSSGVRHMARGCTEVVVKREIMHRVLQFFSRLPSKHLDEQLSPEVVDRTTLQQSFII